MGVDKADTQGDYLGLIGRKKKEIFSFVKDKMRRRIQGWTKHLLSRTGKEILLKTVAHAIPNYAMQVYLLPIDTCVELERMLNSFWWDSKEAGYKRIHWSSWERLCYSKGNGGIGFRYLHNFNMALFARLGEAYSHH